MRLREALTSAYAKCKPGAPVYCVCWQCGRAELTRKPVDELRVVKEVLETVESVGMIVAEDDRERRLLVFCDESCRLANITDRGNYCDAPRTISNRACEVISSVYLMTVEALH